jgi:hypothetical protein
MQGKHCWGENRDMLLPSGQTIRPSQQTQHDTCCEPLLLVMNSDDSAEACTRPAVNTATAWPQTHLLHACGRKQTRAALHIGGGVTG